MSIVMNMSWDGITARDYDRLAAEVRWREEPPSGGRYHLAWFTDDGVRIVDVWDSAEAFGAFTDLRLMPGVAATGLAGEPRVDIWPLYDLQIEGDPPAGSVAVDGMAGMPKDMYQALERKMNWKADPPAGALVHVVAVDGDTVRDVAVWTTAAANQAFLDGPVAAAIAELGADDVGEQEPEPVSDLYAWFDPTRVKASS